MVINIYKKSVNETPADGSTPAQRQLKIRLNSTRQRLTGLRNVLDKLIEVEEDDEEDEIDEGEDANENEDDNDGDDEEEDYNEDEGSDEEDSEDSDDSNDSNDKRDDKNDGYEEDFADADTEGSDDSDDSQATYMPSALNSDGDSSEEEAGSGNEDEALSLAEELGNLGISPDELNK
jgi:hypothetical protein